MGTGRTNRTRGYEHHVFSFTESWTGEYLMPEDVEEMGKQKVVFAKVLQKTEFLAHRCRFDIMCSTSALAGEVSKWNVANDKRLHQMVFYNPQSHVCSKVPLATTRLTTRCYRVQMVTMQVLLATRHPHADGIFCRWGQRPLYRCSGCARNNSVFGLLLPNQE